MITKFLFIFMGLFVPLLSQSGYGTKKDVITEAKDKDLPLIEANMEVSSDFIFRGESFGGEYVARRNNTPYRAYTDSWTFQPDVLFHTPLEGLKFLFWGNLNLQHRRDKDSDYRILQDGAGQQERFLELYRDFQGGGINFDPRVTKAHKEKNGLSRQDGAFLGGYYQWNNRLGMFRFGTWIWNNADRSNKYTWQEWFVVYSPPFLKFLNPELSVYFNNSSSNNGDSNNPPNVTNGQNYISLDFSHTFREEQFFRIRPTLHIGYIVNNNNLNQKSGISNITSGIKFFFGSFYIGGFWVHRPEAHLWDVDNNPRDGKIQDPSKQYGYLDQRIYREIKQVYFNQPILADYLKGQYGNQSILKDLYYITLGYEVRL